MTFPLSFDITLNGQDQVALAAHVVSVNDVASGGRGWRLTISAAQFATSDLAAYALPLTALSVGQGSGATFRGPGAVASAESAGAELVNSLGLTEPLEVPSAPTGGAAPLPATFFVAAAGTAPGSYDVAVPYSLRVPANARAGRYTTTITITQLIAP